MVSNSQDEKPLSDTLSSLWNNFINTSPNSSQSARDDESLFKSDSDTQANAENTDIGIDMVKPEVQDDGSIGIVPATRNLGTASAVVSPVIAKTGSTEGTLLTRKGDPIESLRSLPITNNEKSNSSERPRSSLLSMASASTSNWLNPIKPEKVLEMLFESWAGSATQDLTTNRGRYQANLAPLSLPITFRNYNDFQSRCGIVYEMRYDIQAILEWKNPSGTLSYLIVYSFACLHPRLFILCPFVYLLLGIMAPAYIAVHPGPRSGSLADMHSMPFSGPPLHDPVIPKPVSQFSPEFLANVLDTQYAIGDAVKLFDKTVDWLSTFAYFTNEEWSSVIYVAILFSTAIIYFSSPFLFTYIQWRYIFLSGGWVAMGTSYLKNVGIHRNMELFLAEFKKSAMEKLPDSTDLSRYFEIKIPRLDVPRNFRFKEESELISKEVQIFEIQKFDVVESCWQQSVFWGSPYAHMKEPCESLPDGQLPNKIESVLPPMDWNFETDAWERDYDPQEWVDNHYLLQSRIFIDHDEKWVYDAEDGQKTNTYRRRRWSRVVTRTSDITPKPSTSLSKTE
ncbi:Pex29p [Sugiyamaella lignohabitans]|uniref:Pex29p n=1 Tax=Sugiyamaella lignohabitans TaxID=796027 RepID=A0A167E6E1_9ASCO|nr:Pex29p [Sugiyamaella lignohabitans]ANB13701.1 Pex29p [Sugiyamaella lignohabitans]